MSFKTNVPVITTIADSRIANAVSSNTVLGYNSKLSTLGGLSLSGKSGMALVVNATGTDFELTTSAPATQTYVDTAIQSVVSADKFKVTVGSTATITLTNANHVLIATNTGARTVNLPAGATAGVGRVFVIKDGAGTATTANITVVPNGSETIDGAANYSLNYNYEAITIVWNGTQWNVI